MSKKEYILKVLEALENKWPIAKWLKILVEGNSFDDVAIDGLIDIFDNMLEQITDKETKDTLLKSKSVLEKIKKIEREQHLQDEKSLEDLDNMIQNI